MEPAVPGGQPAETAGSRSDTGDRSGTGEAGVAAGDQMARAGHEGALGGAEFLSTTVNPHQPPTINHQPVSKGAIQLS